MKKITSFWVAIFLVGFVVLGADIAGIVAHAQISPLATTTTGAPIEITPAALPDAVVGVPYSQTLSVVTDLDGPFIWSVYAGVLPDGLSLAETSTIGNSIQLTGTPTVATSSSFTISATNHAMAALQGYVLNVDANGATSSISVNSSANPSSTTLSTSSAAGTTITDATIEVEIANIAMALEDIESTFQSTTVSGASGTAATSDASFGNGSSAFYRDLTIGDVGPDVTHLQQFLNGIGYAVASSGPGSPGNETDYFGPMTQAALANWQSAMGISPANGYFGPETQNVVSSRFSGGIGIGTSASGTVTQTTTSSVGLGAPMIPYVSSMVSSTSNNQSSSTTITTTSTATTNTSSPIIEY